MMHRRAFIAGLLASAPVAAYGAAPKTAKLPVFRRGTVPDIAPSSAAPMVANGFGPLTGFALVDMDTGETLDSYNPELQRPPASVIKSLTAVYARDTLGPEYRFKTRILAVGPIVDGIVQGDLYLQGNGDPELDTDELAELAKNTVAAGVRGATGKFYVDATVLPCTDYIDPTQPPHLDYNPSVCGVNLNFNRVYFEWKKTGQTYDLLLEARDIGHRPNVDFVSIAAEDRGAPIFQYARNGLHEDWTVARSALGAEGGRWLPVRNPALYVGEIFRDVAAPLGLELSGGLPRPVPIEAKEIANFDSKPLDETLRWMLKYSNNLTAEVMGLAATRKRGLRVTDLEQSASAMGRWCGMTLGVEGVTLANHSGLTDETRLTAPQMANALAHPKSFGHLSGILKPYGEAKGGVSVLAKTGTLNFATGLAGYILGTRRRLAFAIFASDMDRRAALTQAQMERPKGGHSWLNVARAQDRRILDHWKLAFA